LNLNDYLLGWVKLMVKHATLLLSLIGLMLFPQASWSATTATATVTYTIGTILAITVSGNPGPLNVTTATAGSPPPSATDSSTTYAVTCNVASQRVTGSLASAMPTGVTLAVTLAAPTGATSAGAVSLTTSAQSLVTAISNVAQSGLAVTYTLTATLSAATVSAATNTVTYTIGP
jgi:hypothetical protein